MSAPQNATLQRLAFAAPAKAFGAPAKAVGRMNMGAAVYNRSISTGFVGTILKYGFYTSLLALFGFLVLITIHYTITPIFSFTVADGIITIPTTQDYQSDFTAAVATVDIAANFINPLSCGFTLMFDIFLQGDFKSTTAPRVLTYRSLDASEMPSSPPSFTPSTDLLTWFPNTNFIVWIDPEVNDLYAGVVTQQPGASSVLIMSPPIKNIPIRKPFRVTFTLSPDFMEIYMNGRLEQTVSITGTVLQCEKPFFAPTSVCDQSIFLANMYYWGRILSPAEIRINGVSTNTSVFSVIKS